MDEKRLLLSMSADQTLRFWDITELQSQKKPVFVMNAGHYNSLSADQLTGVAITMANDRMVTSDTSGRIKMFLLDKVDFKNERLTNDEKLAQV